MPSLKVFRVKIYRRLSGPFEAVVKAPNRKSAQTKTMLKAAKAYKAEQKRLAPLMPMPGLDKPDIEVAAGGIIYHMKKPLIGKRAYPKAWTAGVKLVKPIKLGKGNDLVTCTITLIGKAV